MTSAYRALKAAFRAFARMPLLVLTTFVLQSLLGMFTRVLAEWFGAPFPLIQPQIGSAHHVQVQDPFLLIHSAINLVISVPRALFIAPLAVSVHRFVLIAETRDKVAVDLSLLDVRFAGWVAAIGVATETLVDVPLVLNFHGASALLYLGLLNIPLIFVLSRMSLSFPLLAAGAAAPLKTSWSLTKHHVARIESVTLLIIILTFLLVVLLYFPCRIAMHRAAQLGLIQLDTATTPAVAVYVFVGSTLSIGALAAMASNFLLEYQKPKAD
jgi:hypothetical protein